MSVNRLILAGYAVLLVIMLVGFTVLYGSVSSLRQDVVGVSRGLEEQGRLIEELRRQLSSQAEALRSLEGLRARIESLEASMRDVASASDLERLARELGRISAELKTLSSSLTSVNESLRSFVEELSSRVEELSGRVNALAEQILFPTTIVDGSGDKVTVLRKPSRIVSLAPSVTETLYFVGALDRLVGVDEWSNFPREVVEKRNRGELAIVGYWSPKVEVIVALKPDLVIGVASVPSHKALKNILSQYGIPVILLPDFKLSDVMDSVLIVGRATGNIVKAYETLSQLEIALRYAMLLASKVESKPRVAGVVWVKPLFVVGGGTWEHDILEIVGLNVYGDLSLWPQVSPESLLERAPDVIVMTSSHGAVKAEDLVNMLVGALGDAAYKIPAVGNGRIYVLVGSYEDSFVRPSPRTIVSVYVLLVALHPGLFNLSVNDIPVTLSEDTLDIAGILAKIAPDPVVAIVRSSLKG